MSQQSIEVIARAVVLHDDKLLLCRARGHEWWYFPGGHVEFGETIEIALKREFQEELASEINDISFMGVFENFYDLDIKHHEINFFYKATMTSYDVSSQEDHIEFSWFALSELSKIKLEPKEVVNFVKECLSTREIFINTNTFPN